MNVYTTPQWRALRPLILARDQHTCLIRLPCCTTHATEVDHIVELHRGGAPYDPDNLRAACKPCNSSRGATYGNKRREPRTPGWGI